MRLKALLLCLLFNVAIWLHRGTKGFMERKGKTIIKQKKLFSKNKNAYKYLDESIQKFPEGNHFIDVLQSVGFKNYYFKKLSLGICSIYCGNKL